MKTETRTYILIKERSLLQYIFRLEGKVQKFLGRNGRWVQITGEGVTLVSDEKQLELQRMID